MSRRGGKRVVEADVEPQVIYAEDIFATLQQLAHPTYSTEVYSKCCDGSWVISFMPKGHTIKITCAVCKRTTHYIRVAARLDIKAGKLIAWLRAEAPRGSERQLAAAAKAVPPETWRSLDDDEGR